MSDYKLVRSESAGVFAGELESSDLENGVVHLKNARRIWYWEGAASLSQLAQTGTSKPESCKFPCTVDRVKILKVIEILDVTDAARASIEQVPVWSA